MLGLVNKVSSTLATSERDQIDVGDNSLFHRFESESEIRRMQWKHTQSAKTKKISLKMK